MMLVLAGMLDNTDDLAWDASFLPKAMPNGDLCQQKHLILMMPYQFVLMLAGSWA